MSKGKSYKHRSCLDSAIYILSVEEENEHYKIRAMWYCIRNGDLFGIKDEQVNKCDLNKWEEINEPLFN